MTLPSRRSGGPRTQQGRVAVSKNALKTGTYAVAVVLPGENLSEFAALDGQLMRDYAPQDAVSAALVQSLAADLWKKMRLHRIEHSYLRQRQTAPLYDTEVPASRLGLSHNDARAVLELAMRVPRDAVDAVVKSYNLAAKIVSGERLALSEFADMQTRYPPLWEAGIAEMAALSVEGKTFLGFDWQAKAETAVRQDIAAKFLETHRALPLLVADEARVRACLHAIQEKRLLDVMKIPEIHRAHDHLDRAIGRTLRELRKHLRWTGAPVDRLEPLEAAADEAAPPAKAEPALDGTPDPHDDLVERAMRPPTAKDIEDYDRHIAERDRCLRDPEESTEPDF